MPIIVCVLLAIAVTAVLVGMPGGSLLVLVLIFIAAMLAIIYALSK